MIVRLNDDEYSYSLHMQGSASTLPADDESEGERAVRQLREVVREITGKELDQPAKQRMGFLP